MRLKFIPEEADQIQNLDLSSSSFELSDYDDKKDPNFFVRDKNYHKLPSGVQEAIDKSLARAKHSAFYYSLTDLNDKIKLYKKLFHTKIPSYQLVYMQKKVDKS